MLSRVVKVYSLPNLREYIRASESILGDPVQSWSSFTSSKGSLLTPNVKSSFYSQGSTAGLSQLLLQYESPNFTYTPLFSIHNQEVISLLVKIRDTKEELIEMITASTPVRSANNESFFGSLKELINPTTSNYDEQANVNEYKKTEGYINLCLVKLGQLFDINLDEVSPVDVTDFKIIRRRNITSPSTPLHNIPELKFDDRGTPRLTERGREQVLNRSCKPDINFEGNPDKQPCRTFEIDLLVRFLLFISDWINNRYGGVILDFYNRQDSILGGMVRAAVCPPVFYTRIIKKGMAIPPERVTEHLPPRIQLRALANKFVLAGVFIVHLFFYLFSYSRVKLSVYATTAYLTYVFARSVIEKLTGPR
jgi:hypothetical protein